MYPVLFLYTCRVSESKSSLWKSSWREESASGGRLTAGCRVESMLWAERTRCWWVSVSDLRAQADPHLILTPKTGWAALRVTHLLALLYKYRAKPELDLSHSSVYAFIYSQILFCFCYIWIWMDGLFMDPFIWNPHTQAETESLNSATRQRGNLCRD